jgi:hypothetical protein
MSSKITLQVKRIRVRFDMSFDKSFDIPPLPCDALSFFTETLKISLVYLKSRVQRKSRPTDEPE